MSRPLPLVHWNSSFFEFEETELGFSWRLRLRNNRCIAKSCKHYETIDLMIDDIHLVKESLLGALSVQPLIRRDME